MTVSAMSFVMISLDLEDPVSVADVTGGWVGTAQCLLAQASAASVKVVRERERDHSLGGDGDTKACDSLRLCQIQLVSRELSIL